MFRYIYADGLRSICKPTVIASMCVMLIGLVSLIKMSGVSNSQEYLAKVNMVIKLMPLVLGIPLMSTVFFDDFRSKVVLTFIGVGKSRMQAVFSKYIEYSVLVLLCSCVIFVLFALLPLILGFGITGKLLSDLCLGLVLESMKMIVFGVIGSIFIFALGSGVLTIAVYCILATGFFNVILTQLLMAEGVVKKIGDLSWLLVGNALEEMKLFILQGNMAMAAENVLIWIVYLIIPASISLLVFRRRELEF